MGLDRDGDGDFDWIDMLKWCSETRAGEWMQLPSVYAMAANLNEKPANAADEQQPILDRLDRIEMALRRLPTVGGRVAMPPPPPPRPPQDASDGPAAMSNAERGNLGFFGLPRWTSPANSEAFAAKQRAKLAKQSKDGDLVRVDLV
jgi:hypothetical protein